MAGALFISFRHKSSTERQTAIHNNQATKICQPNSSRGHNSAAVRNIDSSGDMTLNGGRSVQFPPK
jgi:hypothetical protein